MCWLKNGLSPGWCGSVDWVLAYELKGQQFDSKSGHMPGWRARSLVGAFWEATTHRCFSPSLSPSFPLSLKINTFKKWNKNWPDILTGFLSCKSFNSPLHFIFYFVGFNFYCISPLSFTPPCTLLSCTITTLLSMCMSPFSFLLNPSNSYSLLAPSWHVLSLWVCLCCAC